MWPFSSEEMVTPTFWEDYGEIITFGAQIGIVLIMWFYLWWLYRIELLFMEHPERNNPIIRKILEEEYNAYRNVEEPRGSRGDGEQVEEEEAPFDEEEDEEEEEEEAPGDMLPFDIPITEGSTM